MLVRLPTEKIEKVKRITNIKQKTVKIRDFARILGFLVSCCPAVKYGYCYTKNCEREKFLALRFNDSDYNKSMTLPASINEDLRWWNTVNLHKGNPIKNAVYELEIYSDASLTGWGAVCNGEKAHGHWSTLERELHINQLELIAAFFGLRAFAKDCKNCQILLHNTTAISYINRMGRVQFIHLNRVAREIWQWCERRNIWIHATYIAWKDNVADIESRRLQDNTEFTLTKKAFSLVFNSFGYPEIDLFANRGNAKCKKYVSWHRDPDSIAIDAFTILWNKHFFTHFRHFQ
ncbi:hypothetical protein TKK_0001165 [Trichogramma kaykai]